MLEREILLHDSIDFKAKVLIEFHVLFVVGLQGDHHAVGVSIVDGFLHQPGGNAMMLHLRIYCKIDDMETLVLVQLVCPAGI